MNIVTVEGTPYWMKTFPDGTSILWPVDIEDVDSVIAALIEIKNQESEKNKEIIKEG